MTASVLSPLGGITAWDGDVVAAFDRGEEDILVVERPPVPGIAKTISAARVLDWGSEITGASIEAHIPEALDALLIANQALASDIVALSRSFLAQFSVEEASLRVEVVDKQSCPKFHRDNVRIRMVTTYHGPTTEYVPTSELEQIQSSPLFALVFLKGRKHPNYLDAIRHRSPEVPPGGKRLCVILDC
ncbi:MAG: DUF1826 domain-containing protein [Gemmataceae bacterium]